MMLLKGTRWELIGGEITEPIMHHDDGDDEEEEETKRLSFCELSLTSTADHSWEDSSRESQNSSFKSSVQEEDCFEFITEEFRTNSMSYRPPEKIVFCGKLIPSKESSPERVGEIKGKIRHKSPEAEPSKDRFNTRKRSSNHDISVNKMSIFTPTRGQSRWCLLLFGITRFPTQMELRDMKDRQSRRSPSLKSFTLEGGVDKNKCKGIWGLLRALSCGSGDHHHADSVVQAAIGPIPRG